MKLLFALFLAGCAPTVLLPLPHLRQENNLCVPTSAAMVLAYYGDPHPPRELKVLSRGRAYDPEAPFDDFTITWFRDLVAGLTQLQYRWAIHSWADDANGFSAGLAAIRASLRDHKPVLVDTTLYRGHTMVVVGFDDRAVFVLDPMQPDPGLRQIDNARFAEIWSSRAVGTARRGAIFTSPRASQN